MDALIVNPPTLGDLERIGLAVRMSYFEFERQTAGAEGFLSFPGEHLGLLALASSCRAAGLAVAPINGQVANHRSLDETWQAMVAAAPGGPAAVGFSGPCQVLAENLTLAYRVRTRWPDTRIVMGHDFATLNFERLLQDYDCLDAVVVGEGERAFPLIVEAAKAGRSLADIAGVATRDANGRAQLATAAAPPLDLDTLPWVARDHLPLVLTAGMSAGIYTSRGCPYRCSFCTTGQTAARLGKHGSHRLRAIDDVVDEIERLVVDYEIPHLTIVDDLFVTSHPESRERATMFAELLRRRSLNVPFMIDARVDSIDPATFAALRQAGLHRVFVGVETGSDAQLAFYSKGYGRAGRDNGFVHRQMRVLANLGIEIVPGIITYHPESEPNELLSTLGTIDASGYRGTFQFMNRLFVHPGTSLWQDYHRRGLLVDEWPVPRWTFLTDRAAALERDILEAVAAGLGFDAVRTIFEQGVHTWLADQQPGLDVLAAPT
ncbi:B12-binding domain-containing radical SAM protein [Rhizobium grahamii]|uniref:Methyltransferase/methylase n=1 Tax=Rhizobium grahamii CCGE 502 TaxID=990285 RepID=S3H613_9HYPH|nr:radical SAM protein [Rhizobium grahamii]EPE94382.1 methyltransferase/methylase [Rhizobium grahamii CCGE 502]